MANGEAVVGGEDNDRVVGASGGFEGLEDPADLGIHVGDEGVVFAAVQLDRLRCAGPGRQLFVAQVLAASDILHERIGRLVVLRDRDRVGRVKVDKLLWGLSGVVRGIKCEVEEEGFGVAGGMAEEVGGISGEDFAPVLAAFPETAVGGIPREPGIRLSGRGALVGGIDGAGHPWSDVHRMLEDLVGVGLHMPFARHVGFVACPGEELAPEAVLLEFLVELFFGGVSAPERASGVERGAAGDADRAVPCAHVVGTGEGGAGFDESIEVGGLDALVAEGMNRFIGLVVGEDEEDVWRGGGVEVGVEQQDERGEEQEKVVDGAFAHGALDHA